MSFDPDWYGAVEVAEPENTYWPLYWVFASCLIWSISWLTSWAEACMSAALWVPLAASAVSSWIRWTEFVMSVSAELCAVVQPVPSVTLFE